MTHSELRAYLECITLHAQHPDPIFIHDHFLILLLEALERLFMKVLRQRIRLIQLSNVLAQLMRRLVRPPDRLVDLQPLIRPNIVDYGNP
jgi:hypothetical protein